MASVQCYKPNEKTSCHQEQQEHSLSHKVSEMASSIFKGHGSHHSHGETTERYSQTEAYYSDHGAAKTQTEYFHSETQGHRPHHTMSNTSKTDQFMSQTNGHQAGHHAPGATAGQSKTKKRGEHKKRGLLQKIKDGISGDSSDSSSDSESDDEKCGTKKASY